MLTHSKINKTLDNATQVSWKKPSEFKTEAEFSDNFHALPIETQIKMADTNIPAAQRLLAVIYYAQREHEKSSALWAKAAANNDIVALLHEAKGNASKTKLELAKEQIERAAALLKTSQDNDFVAYMQPILKDRQTLISEEFFKDAVIYCHINDLETAKKSWQQAADLNHADAAYHLAKIAFSENNTEGVYHFANLALHLSYQLKKPEVMRAAAHNFLALTKIEVTSFATANYDELFAIVSHLRKATVYDKNNQRYLDNIKKLLNEIDKVKLDETSKHLLLDAIPYPLPNGIIKTLGEMFLIAKLSYKQEEVWSEYPDPRLNVRQVNLNASRQNSIFSLKTIPDVVSEDAPSYNIKP